VILTVTTIRDYHGNHNSLLLIQLRDIFVELTGWFAGWITFQFLTATKGSLHQRNVHPSVQQCGAERKPMTVSFTSIYRESEVNMMHLFAWSSILA
jgi:hypothetical protein